MRTIKALQERVTAGDVVICFWGIGHRPICETLLETDVHVLGPVFLD